MRGFVELREEELGFREEQLRSTEEEETRDGREREEILSDPLHK